MNTPCPPRWNSSHAKSTSGYSASTCTWLLPTSTINKPFSVRWSAASASIRRTRFKPSSPQARPSSGSCWYSSGMSAKSSASTYGGLDTIKAITLNGIHMLVGAMALNVLVGHFQRFKRHVSQHHFGVLELVGTGDADATRAGTQVENACRRLGQPGFEAVFDQFADR